MPPESERARSLMERPGRLAAIGAAVVVCLLTVSGALGLSLTGSQGGSAEHPAALVTSDGTSGGGAAAHGAPAAGIMSPADQSPSDNGAGGTGGAGASTPAEDTALPSDSGHGKRIVFAVAEQRVWLVGADGKVDRTYPVSGSKYHNLALGTYEVTSRSRYATAYNSDETLNFMVRFAYGRTAPIGFHAIPVLPDGTLVETRAGLGKPASDGCIRQWITDARALWNFAPVGTTVVVHP